MKNKYFLFIILVLILTSCQKKYADNHTKDEVIVEFAARLEEQSPKYQYDHIPKKEEIPIKKAPPIH